MKLVVDEAQLVFNCRSPQGERGLKLREGAFLMAVKKVAPRKGSVG